MMVQNDSTALVEQHAPAVVAVGALAVEPTAPVHAAPAVQAGLTANTKCTGLGQIVGQVQASDSGSQSKRWAKLPTLWKSPCAVIGILSAEPAGPAARAGAAEAQAMLAVAGAAVEAGRCLAVIDICVCAVRAVRAAPAPRARAAVVHVQV